MGTAAPARTTVTHRYEPQSADPKDDHPLEKAIATSRLVAEIDGRDVGYLKVSYTTAELAAERFPTPLHYMAGHAGWCLRLDNRAATWKSAHLYAHRPPASMPTRSPMSLTDTDVPDPATVEADLAVLADRYAHRVDRFVAVMSTPFVAYANVDRAWQRRGIATGLYLQMARQLAADGKLLRASGIQSDDAQALWASLPGRTGNVALTTVDVPDYQGQLRTYGALDARV